MVDFDMRSIIDWEYYKERVAGTIMKIVTIPAALQKCMNPVPRIQYPDWLHKRIKAEDEKFKQKDMKHFFQIAQKKEILSVPIQQTRDIEDSANIQKLTLQGAKVKEAQAQKAAISEKQAKYAKIEECPSPEEDFGEWLKYQKSNWRSIRKTMKEDKKVIKNEDNKHKSIVSFIRNMDDVVLKSNWHVIQICETFEPGVMRIWALTDQGQMFNVKLKVPRTIYINSKVAVGAEDDFKKVNKILPRNRKVFNLYEWEKDEDGF